MSAASTEHCARPGATLNDLAAAVSRRLMALDPDAAARLERLEGRRIAIRVDDVEVRLDARRGLAIEHLARVGGPRVIGTLPHGYFDDIHWAADFYSGHAVLDVPARLRATDLERVEPTIERTPHGVDVTCRVETTLGAFESTFEIFAFTARRCLCVIESRL